MDAAPTPIDVVASDPRLDHFRGVRDRELRGTFGLHAVESERVVRRFLAAARLRRAHTMPPILEPSALLVTPDACERLADITAHFPMLPIYRCADERVLHEITGYTMHSGAIMLGIRHADGAIADLNAWLSRTPHEPREMLVALDGITQTDNVGAIFRNAASFGARAAILSPRASDPFLRKTLRVSMGRALNIPWCRATSAEWPICLDTLRREHGYAIIAAEDTREAIELARFTSPERATLSRGIVVFGAEQDGVSRAVLDLADMVVKIPMLRAGTALARDLVDDPPSLNVSIASAVMLHGLLA